MEELQQHLCSGQPIPEFDIHESSFQQVSSGSGFDLMLNCNFVLGQADALIEIEDDPVSSEVGQAPVSSPAVVAPVSSVVNQVSSGSVGAPISS